jgi:hypothetical protein
MRALPWILCLALTACAGAASEDAGPPGPANAPTVDPVRRHLALGTTFSCASTAGARVACWGTLPGAARATPPLDVPELAGAVDLVAFDDGLCARLGGGSVACWHRRFGPRPTILQALEGADALALDAASVCAVRSGALVCMGLPAGTAGPVATVPVPDLEGLAMGDGWLCAQRRGQTVGCRHGMSDPGSLRPVGGTEGARRIALGGGHLWALLPDGTVRHAALEAVRAPGDAIESEPVASLRAVRSLSAGRAQVCVTGDGGASCLDPARPDQPPAGLPGAWVEIALDAAAEHGCARDLEGAVSCWGQNAAGQVGDAPPSPGVPTRLPSLSNIVDVAVVDGPRRLACALEAAGAVRCWDNGRVSEIPVVVPIFPPLVELVSSEEGVCGRDRQGHVYCVRAGALAQSPGVIEGVQAPGGLLGGTSRICALGARDDAVCFGLAPGAPRVHVALRGLQAPFLLDAQICGTQRGAVACLDLPPPSDLANPAAAPASGDALARIDARAARALRGARSFGGAGQWFGAQPVEGERGPRVYAMGENGAGELGLSPSGPVGAPTDPGLPRDLLPEGMAFARHASCAWGTHGPLLCAGFGPGLVPVAPRLGGRGRPGWVEIPGVSEVRTASIGRSSCAVTERGEVWCWGLPPRGDGTLTRHDAPVAVRLP